VPAERQQGERERGQVRPSKAQADAHIDTSTGRAVAAR
jgi:hypothetical protein